VNNSNIIFKLGKISMDQLGNKVVVRGGGVTPFGQIFKDDVNGFSSSSDI
jgi:hypothetical protein